MPPRLTRQHILFVQEYMVDRNASRAALASGYSKKNPDVIGSQLLRHPLVAAMIEEKTAELGAKCEKKRKNIEVTKERWLRELKRIAFADMDDFVEVTRNGIKITATTDRKKNRGHAIQKISESVTKEGGSQSLSLHNKQPALELLAKHYGWIKERSEVTGADGGPQVILTLPKNKREAAPVAVLPEGDDDGDDAS